MSSRWLGYMIALGLAAGLIADLPHPASAATAGHGRAAAVMAAGQAGVGAYFPVEPFRVLDTRSAAPLGADASLTVKVAGVTGPRGQTVPADATAVAVNATVTDATRPSYLTVYPAGATSRPESSNLNFRPAQTIANLVQVATGDAGGVSAYNSEGTVQVVIDVQGYFLPASGSRGLLKPLPSPVRILDTRQGRGALGPDSTLDLQIAGAGGVPATGVAGAVVNLTAVNGSHDSYLVAYPRGGTARPQASNVDFPAGRNLPNRAYVKLDAQGWITVYNSEGTVDLVVDVNAYILDGSRAESGVAGYVPSRPFRILDTRPASQVGSYAAPLGPDQELRVPSPAAAAAVAVLNMTAVGPSTGTFLTVHPGDGGRPLASDLNAGPGDVLPNLVVVRVGASSTEAIYNNQGSTDLLVDVEGWYVSADPAPPPPPSPQSCLPAATAPGVAELPRTLLQTAYPSQGGRSLPVHAGDDLQAVVDAAQPGDTVLLDPGAVFIGNLELRAHPAPGWIVIRTAAPDSALPAQGTRLSPAYSPLLATLVSPNSGPAVDAAPGSGGYRLTGLEVTVEPAVAINYELISLGTNVATSSVDPLPADIVLDRTWVHGNPAQAVKRGIGLNGIRESVVDSSVTDIHNIGQDTQAVGGWNGPGPFKIVNDELQAAGENILFGGADSTIANLVPSDIEIRCNHFLKPLSWRAGSSGFGGYHWSVKNLFELKNARRVLMDGNVLENNWGDAQVGWAVLLTVRTGDANPWAAVEDVTLTHNLIRHTGSVLEATGFDDNGQGRGQRVEIRDNIFQDVDGARWGGDGIGLGVFNGTNRYAVHHNTFLQSGSIIVFDGGRNTSFDFNSNIAPHNAYGVFGSGQSPGTASLDAYCSGYTFAGNVLPGGDAARYPPGNSFPPDLAAVGFVDLGGGDLHLAQGSPYKNAGTDGRDPGADVDGVLSATRQAVRGY